MNAGDPGSEQADYFASEQLQVNGDLASTGDPWGISPSRESKTHDAPVLTPDDSGDKVEAVKPLSPDPGVKQPNGTTPSKSKNFLLAASYVNDAVKGRTLRYNTDEISLALYKQYSQSWLAYLTILILWFQMAIALFEYPAVPNIYVPYWGTMLMEIACLSWIVFRMKQIWSFVKRPDFVRDPKNIVICSLIVLTVIDMVVYIGMSGKGIRVTRPLRPLFLVNMNESKQVRRAFRNIRNTIKDILNVLVLLIFSIALFTLLGFKLFQNRKLKDRDGNPYFDNYFDSFFDLYVLMTTANSPDIMMPSYDSSQWFTVFFILYIIVNTYIFSNLLLAVVYSSYRENLKTEIGTSVYWNTKQLDLAFGLLHDTCESFPTKCYISYETWKTLMKQISDPPSDALNNLYWEVLKTTVTLNDTTSGNAPQNMEGIDRKQFLQVSNLLNVLVKEKKPKENFFFKLMPQIYLSAPSAFVKRIVKTKLFVRFYDLLILMNAICIGLSLEETEWFFLAMFTIEIFLRVYAVGPQEYFQWSKKWNLFDFTIIALAFCATIAEQVLNNKNEQDEEAFPQEVLDLLMVLRCLRIVKIIANYQSFLVIIMTIRNILPSMMIYGAVLLTVYYAFAIIGMEAFANEISYSGGSDNAEQTNCNNPLLEGSEFVRIGYCNNNFNDLLHSFILMFELMVVNQWHVVTEGYERVTSKWARLFFVSIHFFVVLIIMNIFIAFVLEAFILEYSVPKSKMESAVEKTIRKLGMSAAKRKSSVNDRTVLVTEDDDSDEDDVTEETDDNAKPSLIFKLGGGHKNIETLLQRMFESELDNKEEFEDVDPMSITYGRGSDHIEGGETTA